MEDGISGEDEIGGILFGWNLALFELHSLQLFRDAEWTSFFSLIYILKKITPLSFADIT